MIRRPSFLPEWFSRRWKIHQGISWRAGCDLAAAMLVILCALVMAWPEVQGMATTSLWNDELHSVREYSSRDSLFILSYYPAPNNHIFFSFLSSLVPGDSRNLPLKARLVSFAAVAAMIGWLALVFGRARQFFAGAVFIFLLIGNLGYMDHLLQARGYGLHGLGAVGCCLLTWRYFETRNIGSILAVAALVWLGTWTVPTFIFFGGPLLLILWVFTRDGRWFLAGAGCLALIAASYWPVRDGILATSQTYADTWGHHFANWDSIEETFSSYLFFGGNAWVTFVGVVAVSLGFAFAGIKSNQEKAAFCLGLATAIAFAVALKVSTPIPRTVAYNVIIFAFIGVTLLVRVLSEARPRLIHHAVLVGVTGIVIALTVRSVMTFRFIPIEAWQETARTIEGNFPKGTEVLAEFRSGYLRAYLSEDYPFASHLDARKFEEGSLIVVDSAFPPTPRFDESVLPAKHEVLSVSQRRGGAQKIFFRSK